MTTVERVMPCSAAAVSRVLADGWLYATWVVGASRIRAVAEGWPAPGTRIAHSFGIWPLVVDDETVSRAWTPGAVLVLQARGWPAGEARVRITVAEIDGGCRVRISEDAVRGPGTLVPRPLRRLILRPRNTEALRRLEWLALRADPGGSAAGGLPGAVDPARRHVERPGVLRPRASPVPWIRSSSRGPEHR